MEALALHCWKFLDFPSSCLPVPVAGMWISLEKAPLHHKIAIQAHDRRIEIPPPILRAPTMLSRLSILEQQATQHNLALRGLEAV
jgi:hypothetical protein